ncbi:MAG: RAD55 family ATPase [Candidatus Nanoarchaeia archaeon]
MSKQKIKKSSKTNRANTRLVKAKNNKAKSTKPKSSSKKTSTTKKNSSDNVQFSSAMKSHSKIVKGLQDIDKFSISKLKTGISGLDALFDEGIPEGSAVIVEGGPGSGKTTMCLQILYEMVKSGKKALYMSFEEPEFRLYAHMNDFNWDVKKYVEKGLLRVERFNALDIARSVEALLSEAKNELLIEIEPVLIPKDFKPDIIVVDSLSSISSAFSGESSRFRIYMEQLFRYLESNDITSFLIRETPTPSHLGNATDANSGAVSFLSDGIIVVYNVLNPDHSRTRAVEVLKMRGEDIDTRMVEATIKKGKGVIVYPKKYLKSGCRLT